MKPGKFIWYELLTNDLESAGAFYGKVAGWPVQESGSSVMEYRMLGIGGVMVGGLMQIPAGSGLRPCWLGYVGVGNVDQAIAEITGAGGRLYMPATDIADVGRIAMLADPQGASLYVMTPSGQGESPSFSATKPGHVGWNELHAADAPAALEFYAAQFGWGKTGEMDMGPMGTYIMFNTGGDAVGGMMTKHAPTPPHWLFYINVDDITAATARVGAADGVVLNGPHQVPGGQWIIQCQDPQGAMFALVSAEKS